MKQVDYIIVGFGIAGLCFAETLLQHGKTFIVVEDGKEGATTVSGGVLNPTVLKRFTAAWNAAQFFEKALPFYGTLGQGLGKQIIRPISIHRIFNAVEEQNNWIVASDKNELSQFLSTEIVKNKNLSINAPLGLGVVTGGAIINPPQLIEHYRIFLKEKKLLVSETFNYQSLSSSNGGVTYSNISAKQIVFAQGTAVRDNPYFQLSVSPMGSKVFVGNKGEYIIFRAPKLQLKEVLKGPVMIIPLGDHCYKVGASFGRDEFSTGTTQEAREEIVSKLKKMISCDFDVLDQVSGIRPTVKDRKPLLGNFPENKNVYFLNGLGTRGLSMAPLLAEWLFQYVENHKKLPESVNVKRFL